MRIWILALLGLPELLPFGLQGLEPLNKHEGAKSLHDARTHNEINPVQTGFSRISELCVQIPWLFAHFAEAEETRQGWIKAAKRYFRKNNYDYLDALTQCGVKELLYFLHSTLTGLLLAGQDIAALDCLVCD